MSDLQIQTQRTQNETKNEPVDREARIAELEKRIERAEPVQVQAESTAPQT